MNWFRNVSVHSTREVPFLVSSHGMRGHRQDGDVLAGIFFTFPDRRGGFHAVHLRHLDVHEHDVKSGDAGIFPGRERFAARARQK